MTRTLTLTLIVRLKFFPCIAFPLFPLIRITVSFGFVLQPRAGHPCPDEQSMEIEFCGPIKTISTLDKSVFGRVMAINTNGNSNFSRLGGTRDSLIGDIRRLNTQARVAHKLVQVFTHLRGVAFSPFFDFS